MATVAVANQKGGVGKTSLTLNLGWAFAEAGYRVALLDLDPQGHLTAVYANQEGSAGLASWLAGQDSALRIVAPRISLLGMESPAAWPRDAAVIASAIRRLAESHHDMVLLDCPPSEGLLLHAALEAADALLIPLHPDYFSLNGLSRFIQATQAMAGARPFFLVLNRVSRRRRLDEEVRARLESYFGPRLLRTGIREAIAIAESPGFGQSLFQYAPGHAALLDYRAVAQELAAALALKPPCEANHLSTPA